MKFNIKTMLLLSMLLIGASTYYAYDKAPPTKTITEQAVADQVPLIHKAELKAIYTDNISEVIVEPAFVLESWGKPIEMKEVLPPERLILFTYSTLPYILLISVAIIAIILTFARAKEITEKYLHMIKRE